MATENTRRTVHIVGAVADFPMGQHRVVQIGRREIGIFNVAGKLYGLPNVCPHQTGPLCEGPRTTGTLTARAARQWTPEWIYDGEVVTCPWHGMEFHIPSGQCLALKEIRLRQYCVRAEDGQVVVEL